MRAWPLPRGAAASGPRGGKTWDNLGGGVLGTYEVLFQWLAFRRNHTQTHLRRSWPFHLTRKRGIGKTPSTSLACDVSLLA